MVRSCYHDSFNHVPVQCTFTTGFARMGHPCLGSWVTDGLGSENENLPAFMVMATTGDGKGGPRRIDRPRAKPTPDRERVKDDESREPFSSS